MKRKVALKSRTSLNQRSKKRIRDDRLRAPILKKVRQGACLVRWDDECSGQADHGDEILSRARGGSIIDPENVRGACWRCHRKLTDNPAEAERRGLTLHAWERWPRCAACDTPHDPTGACMPGMSG